jgi:hypothetical protein
VNVEPIEHEGRQVIPGEIHDFVNKKPYPLVDEGTQHYTILNDGKPSRVLKAHENKFFKVVSKHQVVGDPSTSVKETQLFGPANKKQRDLIVGTDITRGHRDFINSGIHADSFERPFFTENMKGDKIFVKPGNPEADASVLGPNADLSFSMPQREAAYHNAMHEVFDLGEHVPTTVAFSMPGSDHLYTAMEYRTGKHLHDRAMHREDSELMPLHATGLTQKLGVADWILGNSDRHNGNYLYDNSSGPATLHLLDHGGTFDYEHIRHRTPDYVPRSKMQEEFNPEVKKWIMGLDHKKLEQTLAAAGAPPDTVNTASDRLDSIQSAVYRNERVTHAWLEHPRYRNIPR